eukprot:4152441-Pleurochrysis_carterae.AAC.1
MLFADPSPRSVPPFSFALSASKAAVPVPLPAALTSSFDSFSVPVPVLEGLPHGSCGSRGAASVASPHAVRAPLRTRSDWAKEPARTAPSAAGAASVALAAADSTRRASPRQPPPPPPPPLPSPPSSSSSSSSASAQSDALLHDAPCPVTGFHVIASSLQREAFD